MSKKAGKLQKTIKYRILQGDIVSLVRSTAELYRACVRFCLWVLKDHLEVLDLGGMKHQQGALERLIHKTKGNSVVSQDVNAIAPNIPAYFRRAAINAALGIAQSWL